MLPLIALYKERRLGSLREVKNSDCSVLSGSFYSLKVFAITKINKILYSLVPPT